MLVKTDVPNKQLIECLEKKSQEIEPNCLFENTESILRFYEEDNVIIHEVKDNRVYKLLHRGEDDTSGPADMDVTHRVFFLPGKGPV